MTEPRPTRLGFGAILAMATACGVAVANIYYNQPMLGVIEADFAGQGAAAAIPTLTQVGYAAGLLLLVPLGDLTDRRRLIVGQFGLLAVALALAALAPGALALALASLLVGACAAVAQQIVPFAATLAAPDQRGRVIGLVMGGLLAGILLSRVLSGQVAALWGWRAMFWLGAPLALAAGLLMARTLPRTPVAQPGLGYGVALVSLARLWREEAELRRATQVQAALFASFSAFWTVLALHLAEPGLNLGADAAGLFGVVGLVGVLAAPAAGRLADRHGPGPGIVIGAALAALSWLGSGLWDGVAGLLVGVVVLDLGIQLAMISHQHTIYARRPEARARINTLYMTGMFLGGAAGSAGATLAWDAGGWAWVAGFGAALAVAALLRRLSGRRG